MHLTKLQLRHFRNFAALDLSLNPEFNFVFGRNAQGKTNLIEAIYYLAELKSFRANNKLDLIQKDQEFCKVAAELKKDDLVWQIDLHLTPSERKVLLNQKKPKTQQDYFSLLPLILFEPRHIYLFRDSPTKRRQYLNRALYVQDVSFLKLIRDYEKVIAQKNRCLKDGAPDDLIAVWNDQLINLGTQITLRRHQWFQNIEARLADEYEALSQSGERFRLVYTPRYDWLPQLSQVNEQTVAQAMGDLLSQYRVRERERRESLVGPHRDDFSAYLDEREVGAFGSQGENRSGVIALKLAQLKLFTQAHQKTPLFLLDDVASELDAHRCRYLFDYLKQENTQVFLTTTEHHDLEKEYAGHCSVFGIQGGQIADS